MTFNLKIGDIFAENIEYFIGSKHDIFNIS